MGPVGLHPGSAGGRPKKVGVPRKPVRHFAIRGTTTLLSLDAAIRGLGAPVRIRTEVPC